jgi:hypothetical protein
VSAFSPVVSCLSIYLFGSGEHVELNEYITVFSFGVAGGFTISAILSLLGFGIYKAFSVIFSK